MRFLEGSLPWLLLATCCSPGEAPAKPSRAPAEVLSPVTAGGVVTLCLTAEAVQRLGIHITPVERRPVERTRLLAGVVELPPGQRISVAAPVAGTLGRPSERMKVGERLCHGEPVFTLMPQLSAERDVLSPVERVTVAGARLDLEVARARARGAVRIADARWQAARVTAERAEQLVASQAGSERARDDALAELALAQAEKDAAESTAALLDGLSLDADPGAATTLAVPSPLDGRLLAVHVAAGQIVAAGAPLFEVAQLDPVWIRVPVHVGDLADVDGERPALVGELAGRPGEGARPAQPVAGPPSADATAASVDLWYELPNPGEKLRPGQRVGATVFLEGADERLVVPSSALLYDAQGGTWVYVPSDALTFQRRRVEVLRVDGDLVVLARGPDAGTPIVSVGAAELYGTEFEAGH